MATAYTAPIQYKGYEDQWDEQLLANALSYKQDKYDVNKEKLQSWYNDFATIELAKAEDQQYFSDRLNQVKNQVNKQGLGDLSMGGDNIAAYISQAADGKVENGYYGTLAGRKIQNEAKAMFEKDPKLYAQLNLDYSLKDWNNWANDGTVGSNYRGGSSYVPYTDVNQKIIDTFKEHDPNITVVQTKHGYQFLNYEMEQMSEAEVENILEGLVYSDPNVAQQLRVNSWGTFRGQDNAVISEDMKNNLITKKGKYETALSDVQTKMKTAKGEKLEQLKEYEKAYSEQITSLGGDINNWENQFNKNPDAYKEFAYKSQLTEQMKGIYVKNNIKSISSITDVGALENLQHSNSMAKMREEKALEAKNDNMSKLGDLYTKGDMAGVTALSEFLDFSGQPTGLGNDVSWTEIGKALSSQRAQVGDEALGTPNMETDEVLSKLETFGNEVEAKKGVLDNQLEALGINATTRGGNYDDVLHLINRKIDNETDVVEKQKLQKVQEDVLRLEIEDSAYNAQLLTLVESGLLAGMADTRIGGIGSGRRLNYDPTSGQYYEDDELTVAEVGLNISRLPTNLLTGAGKWGLQLVDETKRLVNIGEFSPYKNQAAVEAANLYFTDKQEFNKKYPDNVKKWTDGWDKYSSVKDLRENRGDVNFGMFAGAVSDNSPSPYTGKMSYKNATLPYSGGNFFSPERTYYTPQEAASLLKNMITSGQVSKPMLNKMSTALEGLAYNDLGVLGKKVSVNDEASQSLYGAELSALIGKELKFKDIASTNFTVDSKGVNIIVQGTDDEEPTAYPPIPLEAALQKPNVGYLVRNYLAGQQLVQTQNLLTQKIKDNVAEDTETKKQLPLYIGTLSLTLENGQSAKVRAGVKFDNGVGENYVPKIFLDNKEIENTAELSNWFDSKGLELKTDILSLYGLYSTSAEAYDAALLMQKLIKKDIESTTKIKSEDFTPSTAYTIVELK